MAKQTAQEKINEQASKDSSHLKERYSAIADVLESQYTFPTDMTHEYYPEAIKFTILKRNGVNLEEVIKTGLSATAEAYKSSKLSNDIKGLDENINELKKNNGVKKNKEKITALESKINTLKGRRTSNSGGSGSVIDVVGAGLKTSISNLKTQHSKIKKKYSEASADIKSTIYLNMPDAMPSYAEKIEWAGSDMGMIGSMVQGGVGEGIEAGVMNNIGTLAAGGIGAAAGKIFGSGGMGGGILGTVLGGDKLQKFSEHSQGAIQNPFKEQTFNGIGFRAFQFSFTMKARSSNDVEVIRGIVDSFRAFSKPSFKDTGSASTFKYPHEFGIEFLSLVRGTGNDAQYHRNENIPAIKYCICDSVTTNFGEAWKAYTGGAPLTVKLDLSFQETELVTQDDILGLGHVGRFAKSGRRF